MKLPAVWTLPDVYVVRNFFAGDVWQIVTTDHGVGDYTTYALHAQRNSSLPHYYRKAEGKRSARKNHAAFVAMVKEWL